MSPLNKYIYPINIEMLFLDILTFCNIKHGFSSEMDFPKLYLISIPDHLMAVPNYELRFVLIFEICFRTVIPFVHQLLYWDVIDHVSLLFGSCS